MKKAVFAALAALVAASAVAAPLNINTASEKELAGLEKIGPVRAKKIVEYRKQNGQFKTKADLKKFISDKEYEAIKEKVIASGTPNQAAPAKPVAPKVDSKAAKADVKTAPAKAEIKAAKADAKPAAPKAEIKTAKPATQKTDAKPVDRQPVKADAKIKENAPKAAKPNKPEAIKTVPAKPAESR